MGFEPSHAKHIELTVQRFNHSATSSAVKVYFSNCLIMHKNMFWNLMAVQVVLLFLARSFILLLLALVADIRL